MASWWSYDKWDIKKEISAKTADCWEYIKNYFILSKDCNWVREASTWNTGSINDKTYKK